jgi:Family of unknown function (DUF5829)
MGRTTYGQALVDHVYAIVDAATADAIEDSGFLRRIAQLDVQVVQSGDQSWRGRYVRGRRTYVEIFGPGDIAGAPDHASGLGLATRRRGDLEVLAGRMGEAAELANRGTTTREFHGEVGPWFDYLEVADETAILSTWIMEYLRDPADDARRVARFDEWAPAATGPVLGDLTRVEIDAVAGDIDLAVPLLRAAEFRVRRVDDGVLASDGHAAIVLGSCTAAQSGMRRLEFRLASPPDQVVVEELGRSTFTLGPGEQAIWEFG